MYTVVIFYVKILVITYKFEILNIIAAKQLPQFVILTDVFNSRTIDYIGKSNAGSGY